MANKAFKEMLSSKQFITAPGVFDLVSAKLADQTKAQAIYMTGYGVVASYLGQPDAGLATYTDMLDRAATIADAVKKPLIADGDTGNGGLLNVHHTVKGYEKAGVTGIQLKDRMIPKKCGHPPNRHVVPAQEMVNKIKIASDARVSKDFLILARTDARTSLGLDEALRRGEAYFNAGADILFIEAPESEAEMKKIGASFDKPLLCPHQRWPVGGISRCRRTRPSTWMQRPHRHGPGTCCRPDIAPHCASELPWAIGHERG